MSGKGRKSECGIDLPAWAILSSGLFSLCLKVSGKERRVEAGELRACQRAFSVRGNWEDCFKQNSRASAGHLL